MTAIEWTHIPGTTGVSWNPIRAQSKAEPQRVGWHCEHVSEACRNCYAERQNEIGARGGTKLPYKPGHRDDVDIYLDEKTLLAPLHWKKPRTIFVCSMTDLFGAWVKDEWLDRIFAVMGLTTQHNWIVLTKRPERMRDYIRRKRAQAPEWVHLPSIGGSVLLPYEGGWPTYVWLGTSVCDQADADAFVPLLLETPAAIRFVSYEPALGPVDFRALPSHFDDADRPLMRLDALRGRHWCGAASDKSAVVIDATSELNWIICGGESGPNARPMHPDWARSVRDQCKASGVPFFFKQWGEWSPHKVVAGGDLGGDVRSGRVRIVHPTGESDVEVFSRTGISTIPGSRYMARLGKQRAGRLLDGVEHSEWPDRRVPLPFVERDGTLIASGA